MPDINVSYIDKRANDKFDVEVTFINKNPSIVYTVADMPTVSATDEAGDDVTADLIDDSLTDYYDDKALIWLKKGGDPGKKYTILVGVVMQSDQEFEKKIILTILN